MELSKRKLDVLSAIVKSYIETGEPIGSKSLMAMLENSPSSATLRNEMNALCGLGFLSQPHTSAGRTPTSMAYKLYVSNLMQPQSLQEQTKEFINSMLSQVGCDTEIVPRTAASVLHRLTGYPVIFYNFVSEDVFVKQIKLLPVNRKTVVLLLILSDGRTKNSVCQIHSGTDADITTEFIKIVNRSVKGKRLNELTRAYMQSIIAAAGINALNLTPLFTALFNIAQSACESSTDIHGTSSLYNFFSDEQSEKIAIAASRESPADVLSLDGDDTEIIFGNDTERAEFKNTVIIMSKFYRKDKFCGKIGIIGPDRMNYEQIIPSIEYISKKITALLTAAVDDMED